MAKSTQAQAAAQIKAKLKSIGINAQVTSFRASMCNGVNVYCAPADIDHKDQIEAIAKPYQYGHFDGMYDIYEYSNMNDKIPQVKFVQISYT